jgi:orotidine-5'-phosphate decarboxylase
MATATCAFLNLLETAQRRNNSLLCVGLDPDLRRFPAALGQQPSDIRAFNRAIIDATADIVCCYKPNLGFYASHGLPGLEALAALRADVPADIPVLLDCKVGDMANTIAAYARGYFDEWGFDAITTNPFQGYDAAEPLLRYRERGVFVLCKTSNPGSGLLQDRLLDDGSSVSDTVARLAIEWNVAGNVGLVVGATYPEHLAAARAIAPELPILVPGIGAQGGDVRASTRAGLDARGAGLLLSASRSVTHASSGPDFQEAARASALELRDVINEERGQAS